MTFEEVAVGPEARPLLPQGGPGISDRQAVTAVATQLGDPRVGVYVTARYGIYSSPYPAKRLPSGEMQPLDQNRPVWLVTYYGPGLTLPAPTKPNPSGRTPVQHQVDALVDASTGTVFSIFG
jgi:hypothetical protein